MRSSRSGECTVAVALPGGSTAELRALSGREEEWLARHRDAPSALTVTRLLDACLMALDGAETTGDVARRLLVGDRDYLILALRRMTLGDGFQGVVACPRCAA